MARHCVKWASGPVKKKGRKKKGAKCTHGRITKGPRKGRCRKGPKLMSKAQRAAWHREMIRSIPPESR